MLLKLLQHYEAFVTQQQPALMPLDPTQRLEPLKAWTVHAMQMVLGTGGFATYVLSLSLPMGPVRCVLHQWVVVVVPALQLLVCQAYQAYEAC